MLFLSRCCLLLTCMIVTMAGALAAIEERSFEDPALQARYHELIAELRCLVCQNQNLADSNADLAKDLRDKTAEMLEQGKSNQEILDYMSERYGDFVLYRPPFRVDTALLWLGPVILLLIVIASLLRFLKRQQDKNTLTASDADQVERQRQRARKLLEENSPK